MKFSRFDFQQILRLTFFTLALLTVHPDSSLAQNSPRKIVLGVDGLSHEAFLQAQRQGLFREFTNVGAHVAPFPSMTDISWATMTHSAELFGSAGRIKNVEATFFDESSQSVQGDPRDYYQRLAAPKYYLGAFQALFNPYVEALVYFPTEEVPKMEIRTVIDDLLKASPKPSLTGYIGSVDSTAHTQINRLYPVLKVLDSEIKRMLEAFRERKEDVEIILVSDHGNVGAFPEGGPEKELRGIEISKVIEEAGFDFSASLKNKNDIAMPLLALGSWGPVYFKDRTNRPRLIQELKKQAWMDLAIVRQLNNARETRIEITSAEGEALIQFNKANQTYSYWPQSGNPLKIPGSAQSRPGQIRTFSADQLGELSKGSPYPDAIFRLNEAASDVNFDFPDLIVTLKDGFFIQNALGGFTKMYRTHGSLSRASSLGLVASTKTAVPEEMRTKDIFPYFKINPRDLFGETLRRHDLKDSEALNEVVKSARLGVETKAKDLSESRIFRHLARFISDTRSYFVVSEIKQFMAAFKTNPTAEPSAGGFSPLNFDISKFDSAKTLTPEDIGSMTDAVLTAGSVEKLVQDPRFTQIKEKVSQLHEQKSEGPSSSEAYSRVANYFLPGKRSAMKIYQIPALLQNSLILQEKSYLPETRNLQAAANWLSQKSVAVSNFKALNEVASGQQVSLAQTLFAEVRKESLMEDKIYPTPLTKLYNEKLENVTVVYVPGIYNGIFDQEIFSLGLASLRDDLGLRVIQPPVESACASDYNGEIILRYIYQDYVDRVQRGHKAPRYLFISYSKGAVDTLHFFLRYPSFVSSHVLGMVSVAAPLHGSSILNKSSLPFSLVSALSEGQTPSICQTEKPATKSILPSSMDSFWRKNERSLIGLTRYFSVTFESSPEESHLFMKATKMIAQFDEDNDGVVTVSSSKFPEKLKAVDLGTVHADHLAGILSSNFNQKAFMKALVQTAAQLQVNDPAQNFRWNASIIQQAAANGPYFWSQPSLKNIPAANSFDLNRQLLPPIQDPADTYEVQQKLPDSQLKYDPYNVLDLQKLAPILEKSAVSPASNSFYPNGIQIDFHHQHMVHFRMDHQFNYESRSPVGLDDNKKFGFAAAEVNGEKDWLMMRSEGNSIRLTTLAYRFSPLDFPSMDLRLLVTKDVVGADSIKGKSGKDDSPFQLWLTLREGRANGDRSRLDANQEKVILFGYYWGSPVEGETRQAGAIFENYYSNKNIVVTTLPEAKQLLLNSSDMLGKPQTYHRSLAEDLRAAFPGRRIENMEVIGITFQHDSNDTGTSSEAYFKSLRFSK